MKRSEINSYLAQANDFLAAHHFCLPPFADFTPEQWRTLGPEADEIRSRALGWDITDFGSNDFLNIGLTVFTLRNGRPDDPQNRKLYAEKILIVRENQITPFHFHFSKTEDIINRGAGLLDCTLFNSHPDQSVDKSSQVSVSLDGILHQLPPGSVVTLHPGQSITLTPGLYHQLRGRLGAGTALIGEVSSINNDSNDNRFHIPLPRYPAIVEDAPPFRLLCTEYPPAAKR